MNEIAHERRSLREEFRYWLSVIPGTKRDYFLITLAVLDSTVILISGNFLSVLPAYLGLSIVIFDLLVVAIWGGYFLRRLLWEEDRWGYVTTRWYEVIGLIPIPLSFLRYFLLLRAVKLAIAYYKLGRSEQDVSRLVTRDLTFRFRDVIVDTIADAVFLKSLERVQEVMTSIDYEALSRKAIQENRESLRQAVSEALEARPIIGELKAVPIIGPFAGRLTGTTGSGRDLGRCGRRHSGRH